MSQADRDNLKLECGCWDEPAMHRAFSLAAAEPMPERADFTDNCLYIRHFCEKHWRHRVSG